MKKKKIPRFPCLITEPIFVLRHYTVTTMNPPSQVIHKRRVHKLNHFQLIFAEGGRAGEWNAIPYHQWNSRTRWPDVSSPHGIAQQTHNLSIDYFLLSTDDVSQSEFRFKSSRHRLLIKTKVTLHTTWQFKRGLLLSLSAHTQGSAAHMFI